MKIILHKSGTRGHADYEWLNSYHCFSFTHYHNPERMLFGVLKVLNDDMVVVGLGFDNHPYSNMEIISIKNIETNNSLYQILSPNGGEDGVWIHQDTFRKLQIKKNRFLRTKDRRQWCLNIYFKN